MPCLIEILRRSFKKRLQADGQTAEMVARKHTSFSAQVNYQLYMHSLYFLDPSCIHVENGCFFAEPSCKRYDALNDDYKS